MTGSPCGRFTKIERVDIRLPTTSPWTFDAASTTSRSRRGRRARRIGWVNSSGATASALGGQHRRDPLDSLLGDDRIAGPTNRARAHSGQSRGHSGQTGVELPGQPLPGFRSQRSTRAGHSPPKRFSARGARQIEESLKDQPEVKAPLAATIGEVYTNLGLYAEAEPLLRDALQSQRRLLGRGNTETLATAHRLANLYGISKGSQTQKGCTARSPRSGGGRWVPNTPIPSGRTSICKRLRPSGTLERNGTPDVTDPRDPAPGIGSRASRHALLDDESGAQLRKARPIWRRGTDCRQRS